MQGLSVHVQLWLLVDGCIANGPCLELAGTAQAPRHHTREGVKPSSWRIHTLRMRPSRARCGAAATYHTAHFSKSHMADPVDMLPQLSRQKSVRAWHPLHLWAGPEASSRRERWWRRTCGTEECTWRPR